MEIDAKTVMALRNKTGLSMMECKKALQESSGNMEAAEDLLRKKLKGKMDARTERAAGEGRIAIATNPGAGSAAIIELRAETDFTAKNEKFISVANRLAELALDAHAGEITATAPMTSIVDDLRITTGENCALARGHKVIGKAGETAYGTYVHHDGKTGVLVHAEGSISDDTLRQVCMHITAAHPRPLGVSADDIPADVVEKERKFRIEQAIESGKPKEIAEKMVEGGMRKFFEEIALLEQPFIKDPTKKVKDIVGAGARIVGFYRWQVGQA
ncbi:MAG: translation elongation factor Ts [Phycisphaeraceae bacterium]|nr:translation elongation factor Ts [Phycisphaeraceae bacterium]